MFKNIDVPVLVAGIFFATIGILLIWYSVLQLIARGLHYAEF